MVEFFWEKEILGFDERRDLIIPGNHEQTLDFCTEHFITLAEHAIQTKGFFNVALSGGSTPGALFKRLAKPENRPRVKWENVRLFWSDERSVPPSNPESNYHMAMESGFKVLPLKVEHIFRMHAEDHIEQNALAYENLILKYVPNHALDLVMLGMGEDGHTASLFPKTHALHAPERLVVANFVPQKNTWRMTFTFECINAASAIVIYVLGKGKKEMLKHVLTAPYDPDNLPAQRIGVPAHKALWIADNEALPEYPF
ncbi:6-phosphogluconolactonase [Parachlamydia acanthamoebae UV-7]|uniref:6-phosphogluconolactonase n=2 Tax=Parachlamydia acanthamoebae TaxID=83552 RepID=F8L057_PARAV|nr:6-phosphogluconolactonase [Parachlamydia acanthamoebae]CCB86583.1 6-phosphogluconolactonase [Parachlamydia acanthamoebae UV-7]